MVDNSGKLKILLVDDNESTNFFNEIAIRRACKNTEVNIATNGKQAFEIIESLNELNKLPDVIFLDINMPILGGIEFLEIYSKSSYYNFPKIIFTLSTEIKESDKKRLEVLSITYETCEKMLKKSTLDRYFESFVNTN